MARERDAGHHHLTVSCVWEKHVLLATLFLHAKQSKKPIYTYPGDHPFSVRTARQPWEQEKSIKRYLDTKLLFPLKTSDENRSE